MLCLVTKATAKVNLFFELTNIFSFFLQFYLLNDHYSSKFPLNQLLQENIT